LRIKLLCRRCHCLAVPLHLFNKLLAREEFLVRQVLLKIDGGRYLFEVSRGAGEKTSDLLVDVFVLGGRRFNEREAAH